MKYNLVKRAKAFRIVKKHLSPFVPEERLDKVAFISLNKIRDAWQRTPESTRDIITTGGIGALIGGGLGGLNALLSNDDTDDTPVWKDALKNTLLWGTVGGGLGAGIKALQYGVRKPTTGYPTNVLTATDEVNEILKDVDGELKQLKRENMDIFYKGMQFEAMEKDIKRHLQNRQPFKAQNALEALRGALHRATK